MKLDHLWIRGSLLTWIGAFLTNRRHRVICGDCHSSWLKVTSGVPQGSILGPLLFLIYVNDISVNLDSPTKLFADDCVLFREIKGSSVGCDILQRDLSRIYDWSQKWQLSLNVTKCKVLCISNRKLTSQYCYKINNLPLEWVDTFKYLAVLEITSGHRTVSGQN